MHILMAIVAALSFAACASAQTLKVGSKNFTEQFVVAELYAAALEAAGFKVERKINLGATLIAHEALRQAANRPSRSPSARSTARRSSDCPATR